MNIIVLNGSPRPKGNTAAMVAAFAQQSKPEETLTPLTQFGKSL